MSFFKDFKEDFSQAVNELVPEEAENDEVVNNLDDTMDLQKELSKLDEYLAEENKDNAFGSAFSDAKAEEANDLVDNLKEPAAAKASANTHTQAAPSYTYTTTSTMRNNTPIDNEVAVITKGMVIHGDVETTGPIEIRGSVNGNVTSNGKITVTGLLKGDAKSVEFYADNARIDGEINADGTVKIGAGSVIRGNISANSSVIAGAVKGDIDVHGPVVVDTSAVVMGNIKSKSVQINNGAVIEGFCSQCYADIDVENLFGDLS